MPRRPVICRNDGGRRSFRSYAFPRALEANLPNDSVCKNGCFGVRITLSISDFLSRRSKTMAFTKVAAVGEVIPGKAKQVVVNGRTLGLYNVNGAFYAIDDTCPHRGAPLSEGECEVTVVTSPWHSAQFDVT